MKYLIIFLSFFFVNQAFAQCDAQAKHDKSSALIYFTDIDSVKSGQLGVVGYMNDENANFPYYFEIRRGSEKGEILQTGTYNQHVELENKKYEILSIDKPGDYVIKSCFTKDGKAYKNLKQVRISNAVYTK